MHRLENTLFSLYMSRLALKSTSSYHSYNGLTVVTYSAPMLQDSLPDRVSLPVVNVSLGRLESVSLFI